MISTETTTVVVAVGFIMDTQYPSRCQPEGGTWAFFEGYYTDVVS